MNNVFVGWGGACLLVPGQRPQRHGQHGEGLRLRHPPPHHRQGDGRQNGPSNGTGGQTSLVTTWMGKFRGELWVGKPLQIVFI